MSQLAIYYHRASARRGTPLVLSNGTSEIKTDKIILDNIKHAEISYCNVEQSKMFKVKRQGVSTVFLIDIEQESPIQSLDAAIDEAKRDGDISRMRALQERKRYRELHPIQIRNRKSDSD